MDKNAKGGSALDFSSICDELERRYPQWSERIRALSFREALSARPVDNDGRQILYNERLMTMGAGRGRIACSGSARATRS